MSTLILEGCWGTGLAWGGARRELAQHAKENGLKVRVLSREKHRNGSEWLRMKFTGSKDTLRRFKRKSAPEWR